MSDTAVAEPLSPSRLAHLLGRPVERVVARRSPYSTSHPVDLLDVVFTDGSRVALLHKELTPSALLPAAVRRPRFLDDPSREPAVYAHLLDPDRLGTPRLHGVAHGERGRWWLLLERVAGTELQEIGDLARWEAAARWAARLHAAFSTRADELGGLPLLRHDHEWVRRWARRAAVNVTVAVDRARTRVPSLRAVRGRLLAAGGAVAERFAALPTTLVHGELYPANVLVGPPGPAPRVCAVDWEMAALGPGAGDLAALTSGSWPDEARVAIERAYCDEAGIAHDAAFAADLDTCRLVASLQWLGWSSRWRPPAPHDHDWLATALDLTDRLEVA